MREKFTPGHRSRDTAHAQWLQTHCQWYRRGDVRTHNLRTDSRRIFKLGRGVDHVTRHVQPLTKVKRSKVRVTRSRNVSAAIAYNYRQRMIVSTLKLVETFIARGETCEALYK